VDYISITNWDKYQNYKRRNPPWVRLYNSLLDDYDYYSLTEIERNLLVTLFLLASKTQNAIPFDTKWIKEKAHLKRVRNLQPLINKGFIKITASTKPTSRKQSAKNRCGRDRDRVETETETETDSKRGFVSGGFKNFWFKYPRKKNKGLALKAWKQIKPNQALQTKIFEAIENAKTGADWLKDEGQFIPYPASWLNAKGWEDEIVQKRSMRTNNDLLPVEQITGKGRLE